MIEDAKEILKERISQLQWIADYYYLNEKEKELMENAISLLEVIYEMKDERII